MPRLAVHPAPGSLSRGPQCPGHRDRGQSPHPADPGGTTAAPSPRRHRRHRRPRRPQRLRPGGAGNRSAVSHALGARSLGPRRRRRGDLGIGSARAAGSHSSIPWPPSLVVVVTGNHYWADGAISVALCILAGLIVRWASGRRPRGETSRSPTLSTATAKTIRSTSGPEGHTHKQPRPEKELTHNLRPLPQVSDFRSPTEVNREVDGMVQDLAFWSVGSRSAAGETAPACMTTGMFEQPVTDRYTTGGQNSTERRPANPPRSARIQPSRTRPAQTAGMMFWRGLVFRKAGDRSRLAGRPRFRRLAARRLEVGPIR